MAQKKIYNRKGLLFSLTGVILVGVSLLGFYLLLQHPPFQRYLLTRVASDSGYLFHADQFDIRYNDGVEIKSTHLKIENRYSKSRFAVNEAKVTLDLKALLKGQFIIQQLEMDNAQIDIRKYFQKDVNEEDILPMAKYFKGSRHILRFIEFMDVGNSNGWNMNQVVSGAEIIKRVSSELPVEPVEAHYRGEVAKRWRYKDGGGEIGIITSVTQAFCRDCNRMRLSAEGSLYTCLFASLGTDLRRLIRENASDEYISEVIASTWKERTDRYSEIRGENSIPVNKVEMSYIGG